MIQERHVKDKLAWPDGRPMAVTLTFDFQGGEDVKPDKNGKMNHEEWTQAEYGPRTGIWSQSDVSHLRRHRRALSGTSESDRAKRSRDRRPRLSSRSGAGSDLGAGTGSYTKDYRDDREAHREAAGRMALLHPKPQQPATADGERLSLEQQFVFL